jgi:drug/metabolite transporter (DMT)-like permease
VTAANFARSVPLAVVLVAVVVPAHGHLSAHGALLAVASGALASGVGYSLWYAALPHLAATRAAIVQLAVPVLAAAGGAVILAEAITLRFAICAAVILGGVALAVAGRRAR